MKISTEIKPPSRLVAPGKAVELVAKAGFDAWDFSMFDMHDGPHAGTEPLMGANYLSFARKLKQIGLDHGIICNQSHAPFPSEAPHVRPYLQRAIECTAEAECYLYKYNSENVFAGVQKLAESAKRLVNIWNEVE